MAFTWNIDTTEDVDFDSFLEYFKGVGPGLFGADMDASALMMRRLANNRTFLTERLNSELESSKNAQGFQAANVYTPQSFMLSANRQFYIRANIWAPAQKRPGESLYFYDVAHDHNFSFMTVGYYGPGYRTQIHEYDPETVVGYPDEPVKLRFLEETTLPFGKVLFFRQGLDIHTQLPPTEISISINVLKRPAEPRPDQYFFDPQAARCLGKADKHPVGLLIRIAGAIGDERSADLLKRIIGTQENRRTRLAAYEAVASLSTPTVWEAAASDKDELVRVIARRRLRELERSSGLAPSDVGAAAQTAAAE